MVLYSMSGPAPDPESLDGGFADSVECVYDNFRESGDFERLKFSFDKKNDKGDKDDGKDGKNAKESESEDDSWFLSDVKEELDERKLKPSDGYVLPADKGLLKHYELVYPLEKDAVRELWVLRDVLAPRDRFQSNWG